MKNTVFTVISIVALVGACVLAYFTGNTVLDYLAITVACAVATALVIRFCKNPGKSMKLNIGAVVLFVFAGIFGALAGLSEESYKIVATAVLSLISVIAGLIVANKSKVLTKS